MRVNHLDCVIFTFNSELDLVMLRQIVHVVIELACGLTVDRSGEHLP